MTTETIEATWNWMRAVLVSSALILAVSSVIFAVSERFSRRWVVRLSHRARWILVLPTAVAVGLIAEVIPRVLFTLILELPVNHQLTYRTGFDFLVWQLWAPLLFVREGVWVAPTHKFPTFAVVGGLKVLVALVNLYQDLTFIQGGGSWVDVDPITNSPVWWNVLVYATCVLFLIGFGLLFARQTMRKNTTDVFKNDIPMRSKQWCFVILVSLLSGLTGSLAVARLEARTNQRSNQFLLEYANGKPAASLTLEGSDPVLRFFSLDGKEKAEIGLKNGEGVWTINRTDGSLASLEPNDNGPGYYLMLLESHGIGQGVFMSMLTSNELGIYQSRIGAIDIGKAVNGPPAVGIKIYDSDNNVTYQAP